MTKNVLIALMLISLFACKENNRNDKKNIAKPGATMIPVGIDTVFSLSMIANLPAAAYEPTYSVAYFKKLVFDSARATDTSVARILRYSIPIMDSTLLYATDSISPQQNVRLSNWQRVWGPAVAVNISDMLAAYVSSASMTIFKDQGNNYVVAIQATNPYSNRDWSKYDFNVTQTVPWTNVCTSANSGNISEGTFLGLNSILALTSNNMTATQFLDTVFTKAANQQNIIITGHSLGGALSPVYTLYLQHQLDSMVAAKIKNTGNNTLYCLSTAGATPGDVNFANYYNSVDNGLLFKNTTRIWNYFDLVPRAWDSSLLAAIGNSGAYNGLYDTPGVSCTYDPPYNCNKNKQAVIYNFQPMPTPAGIDSVINYVLKQANTPPIPYMYLCNNGSYFMGGDTSNAAPHAYFLNVDTSGFSDPSQYAPINIIKTVFQSTFNTPLTISDYEILCEEGAQHVAAYGQYFHIKAIHEYMKSKVQSNQLSAVNADCYYFKFPWPLEAKQHTSRPLPQFKTDPASALLGLIYLQAWKY